MRAPCRARRPRRPRLGRRRRHRLLDLQGGAAGLLRAAAPRRRRVWRSAAPDLLHLATRSGALALGLGDEVGDLSVGQAVRRALDPAASRSTRSDVGLRHAASPRTPSPRPSRSLAPPTSPTSGSEASASDADPHTSHSSRVPSNERARGRSVRPDEDVRMPRTVPCQWFNGEAGRQASQFRHCSASSSCSQRWV